MSTLQSHKTGGYRVIPTLTSGQGPARQDDHSAGPLVVNALDRQAFGGPDDNSAQAGHLIAAPGPLVRRLQPVECERLMSWPDGWTAIDGDDTPDSRRYAACGDGVVSNVAEWIGRRLVAVDLEQGAVA